jgi:hypothetical protein
LNPFYSLARTNAMDKGARIVRPQVVRVCGNVRKRQLRGYSDGFRFSGMKAESVALIPECAECEIPWLPADESRWQAYLTRVLLPAVR